MSKYWKQKSPRLPSGHGHEVTLSVGTLLGNMEGAPLRGTLRERQQEIYEERCKNALQAGMSLHRGPIGDNGGDSLAGTF